ncbi:hypothetical protein UT300005_00010 [Clostridium sp. CTA-5]
MSGGIYLLSSVAKGSIALSKSKKAKEFIDLLKGTKIASKTNDKIDDFEKWLKGILKPNEGVSVNKGVGKAEAIREDMLNNGAKWKSDKALDKHVAKRIKKGHIPDDWTAEEYNNKINEIMEKDNLEVYEYTKNEKTGEPFEQKYYIYGDSEWVVMVGENGAMETAFPPDAVNGGYSGYLESLKVDRIK